MAIIKNIQGTTNLKKVLPNKIPVREKWEQYKKKGCPKAERKNETLGSKTEKAVFDSIL